MHKKPTPTWFLEVPRAAIPVGITPDELRRIGGKVILRRPDSILVAIRELPPRETWKRWRVSFGVRLRARSWNELRDLLPAGLQEQLFRAKVVREVEGRRMIGYVLEADVLPSDQVLARGRAPSRRG